MTDSLVPPWSSWIPASASTSAATSPCRLFACVLSSFAVTDRVPTAEEVTEFPFGCFIMDPSEAHSRTLSEARAGLAVMIALRVVFDRSRWSPNEYVNSIVLTKRIHFRSDVNWLEKTPPCKAAGICKSCLTFRVFPLQVAKSLSQ